MHNDYQLYKGIVISTIEKEVIENLEQIIGKPIPRVDKISWKEDFQEDGKMESHSRFQMGFEVRERHIVALGLNFSYKDPETRELVHFFENKLTNFTSYNYIILP